MYTQYVRISRQLDGAGRAIINIFCQCVIGATLGFKSPHLNNGSATGALSTLLTFLPPGKEQICQALSVFQSYLCHSNTSSGQLLCHGHDAVVWLGQSKLPPMTNIQIMLSLPELVQLDINEDHKDNEPWFLGLDWLTLPVSFLLVTKTTYPLKVSPFSLHSSM